MRPVTQCRTPLFDAAAVAQAERDRAWLDGWDRWLRAFRWDWFATLTWASPASEARAQRDVAHWFKRVQRKHPDASAVVSFEVSPGGLLHAHGLVYLNGARYGLPGVAGQRHLGHLNDGPWYHGNTQVALFRPFRHPGRGAARYTVKGLTEVELYGHGMPPAYRPRRRSRRARRGVSRFPNAPLTP